MASPFHFLDLVYALVYVLLKSGRKKRTRVVASPCRVRSSGGRIRTSDLRVMSPTSYQAALPRGVETFIFLSFPIEVNSYESFDKRTIAVSQPLGASVMHHNYTIL